MPLRDDLLNPIEGENPSGSNLRYDPVFDKIKEARREEGEGPLGDSAPRDRKTADYKLVIKLAGDTLATKTKDLQLSAWLMEALLRQEGFSGLGQGLELLRGMVDKFWETLYPEIEDGDLELRAAPLEWVGTRLVDSLRQVGVTRSGLNFFKYKEAQAVGYEADADSEQKRNTRQEQITEGKITGEDFDSAVAGTATSYYEAWVAALATSLETMDALNSLCQEKFTDGGPNFTPLRSAIDEIHHALGQILQKRAGPAPEPEAEPEPEPEPQPGQYAGAPVASAPRRKVAVGIEPEDLDDVAVRLNALARYLRLQDSYNPAPYLLLRGYRWGELRGFGETPDPLVLEPPSSEIRQSLRRLSIERNWTELLEAAETAMAQPCGRAWLDLQRYVVRAADEYGYPGIASAVRSELRALLTDLPQLPEWTLMDDTPTANAETQAWLKEIAKDVAPAVEPSYSFEPEPLPEATPDEPVPPDTYQLALDAARSGRTQDAIRLLSDDIPRQQSGRARFERKIQLARICMMTGYEMLAQPILEELVRSIEQHRLEDWEAADLVAHPLTMLYKCLTKLDGDPAVKQKLYSQISRLDPVQALECGR